ncbi:unnamed protein product [Rangifer tarandus platyrhynchus]|uniref:Uncharacterized protein n=1 Tax=Rangifer tarandus platyrhynchus TaxID=3082113 RepID=A0AC59Y8B2_RANTA
MAGRREEDSRLNWPLCGRPSGLTVCLSNLTASVDSGAGHLQHSHAPTPPHHPTPGLSPHPSLLAAAGSSQLRAHPQV